MNQLVTTGQGGFPLFMDDIRYADDAVRLALADMARSMVGNINTGEAVIMYGASHGNGSATAGLVYYNNELWHMEAHNFAFQALTRVRICFVVENDQAGSRIFKDGSLHQVYQTRKAVFADVDDVPGGAANVQLLAAKTINDAGIMVGALSFENPQFTHRQNKASSFMRVGKLVVVDLGIETIITGLYTVSSWASASHIATLPNDFKPLQRITGTTLAEGSNGVLLSQLLAYEITNDGSLRIRALEEIQSVTNLSFNIHASYIV